MRLIGMHLSSSTRIWPGFRSEYAWVPPHEGETVTKAHQIGVSFGSHRKLVQQHDGREREIDVESASAFVTAGEPILWRRVREHTEALEIYPDPEFVEAMIGEPYSTVGLRPSLGSPDTVVMSLAIILRRVHVAGEHLTDVAASGMAVRLIEHLLLHYSDTRLSPDRLKGVLDRRRLRCVEEFVETNLANPISVVSMAQAAELSCFHFSRSFGRATGMSPHAYVNARRMTHAKNLLVQTRLTVEAVADAVGFSNLNHFRRLFKAEFGSTPSAVIAQRHVG